MNRSATFLGVVVIATAIIFMDPSVSAETAARMPDGRPDLQECG
jgi:hypothetical protein